MMEIPFIKMEGAGNDYIYVDAIRGTFPIEMAAKVARSWSNRNFGIGADGLILLLPSEVAAVRMAMWNADGSQGRMCGNGLRCIAKLAHDHGHVRDRSFLVETDAGVRAVELVSVGGDVAVVKASMGRVSVSEVPIDVHVCGRSLKCTRGDAGNPHAVVFLDGDPDAFPVVEVGTAMQSMPIFAGGVNVEFVQVLADGSLRQRTFERGSGETLACGTGAVVAATAAAIQGRVQGDSVRVRLRGGDLIVHRGGAELVLEGPARTVYRGSIPWPQT